VIESAVHQTILFKTTVTIKKPQPEIETTQVTINSNPLGYFTNLLSNANPENITKEKKDPTKKA